MDKYQSSRARDYKNARRGQTRQEIADALGLEKSQIKNWISRHNREEKRLAAGILPKRKG